MRQKLYFLLCLLFLVTACKTTDFSVVDSSYQQWYDGRGTTSGVNFYVSLKANKKLKSLKFTGVDANNHHLNPIAVIGKKRVTDIYVLEKNDTVRIAAPLVMKGKKPQITDSTTVILSYERKNKVYQISVTKLVRKKKLFYP